MPKLRVRFVVRLAGWMLPLILAGGVAGCGGPWLTVGEHSVSERDGHLVVDGVQLEHDRWVDFDVAAAGIARLEVETATGTVELQGGGQEGCRLSVHVYSSVAGDGEVLVDSGRLSARSEHGGTVFINGVRGCVPEELPLRISTGTGSVLIERAAKGRTLTIGTGAGDVTVRDSEPSSLDIDVGAASVRLERGGSPSVQADCGAGDVKVVDGAWGTLTVEGGATDLTVQGATVDSVRLDSGTGDLRLEGCTVGRATLDSGTGDLVFRGGSCQRAVIDSGTGEILVQDGARVESRSDG